MMELKKLYQRTSKKTRNRIQELIDTFNFTNENIFNISDLKTKKRINTYIEQWKDDGLLIGYFGTLAKNIYSRSRVKNSEILELLIYSAYIEENTKQEEKEMQIFKEDTSYYYSEGINEVRKAKKHAPLFCIIPDSILLALMENINAMGYNWKQYIELSIMNNANQIYRQVLINLQQQKDLKMDSDEFDILFKRQDKQKLNINGDKISGVADTELIGLNNQAKIKGIEREDSNAQVKFLAVTDEHSTEMCQSMKDKLFYINKDNEFYRMYGETKEDLRNYRIKCHGLVLGLNLPPISHHWHWCRSTITYYAPPLENKEKREYNLDIPKISKEVQEVLENTKLNRKTKKLFNKYLTKDNVVIDNNNAKAMYYDIEQDKIVLNPNHKDFKCYNLNESLSHEIIHLIERRNNININIESELRRLKLELDINSEKYENIFNNPQYENNMCLSDLFSAISDNKIKGNYYHSKEYWLDYDKKISEITANMETIYINKDTEALKVISSIKSLEDIKNKVVQKYNDFTK